MKRKTAEKSAVRWGWVIFAVLFFFGAAFVLELRSSSSVPGDIASLVRADVLGSGAGDAAQEKADGAVCFLDELKNKMDEAPADGNYGDQSPAEMLQEKLGDFPSSVFTQNIGLRVELRLDGVDVWDNGKPADSAPQKVDGVGDALRKVLDSETTPEIVYSFPAYTFRLRDLFSEDVYTRALALDTVSKENEKDIRTSLIVLVALTMLCVWFALRGTMREGNRPRSARRLIDQLPADLYIVCVLPEVVWMVCLLRSGNLDLLNRDGGALNLFAVLWKPLLESGAFLLGLLAALLCLYSFCRGGVRFLFTFFRYEKVPFVQRTIYYLLFVQGVKIFAIALFLTGEYVLGNRVLTEEGKFIALLLFLVLEKLVLLPVLLRCVREMRSVIDATALYVQGDLSAADGDNGKGMYRSFAMHRKDVDTIARRIRDTADEYVQGSKFKAELITNLSHDIKTPLTSIINYAQLLRDPRLTAEEKSHYLQVLQRHSDRLTKLVEDLTQVSDAAAGNIQAEMTAVDLCALVRQTSLGFEERLAKRGITMQFFLPEEPIYVHADSRLLWRVSDNLMNNICKYAKENTQVKIAVVERRNEAVAVYHNVSEADLGDTRAEKLMERFVRGDDSRHTEGSGLGLAIARSLMELQDGSLTLQTENDQFSAQVILRKV